jgi:FkbM family methyltransferase
MTNFAGPIYSFEPDPQTFALLRATAAGDPNWKIFNLALGAKNAVLPFNIMSMSVFNSFRKPAADNLFPDDNKVVTRTDISVVRLDDFVKDQGVSFHTAYLKTDTQSFDLEVLRGSTGIMDCIEAIQTELSFLPIYEKTPDITWSCGS